MTTPPNRQIVLDDTDPSISYSGSGWVATTGDATRSFGNFGPAYNNTLHRVSSTEGASFTFQFHGSQVQIVGSLDNQSGKPIPSWQCFIDGILFGSTFSNGVQENHIILCDSSTVSNGVHQVDVSVLSSGPIFYFDNVFYLPSPSVSLTSAVIKVENNDSSLSFVGSGWISRYANLWPLTGTTGDQMIFPFNGKSVLTLGIAPLELNGNPSSGTFSIDNSPPTSFIIPGHGSFTEYNQVLFQTPEVESGSHILTVTYHGDDNSAPFVLNWLYVANGSQPAPSSTANPPSMSSLTSNLLVSSAASPSTSSASLSGPSGANCAQWYPGRPPWGPGEPWFQPGMSQSWSSTGTPPSGIPPWVISQCMPSTMSSPTMSSPTTSSSASSSAISTSIPPSSIPVTHAAAQAMPIGAIVGGALGGLLVLVLLLFAAWRLGRHRSHTSYDPSDVASIEGAPQPFTKFPDIVVSTTPAPPESRREDHHHDDEDPESLRVNASSEPTILSTSKPEVLPARPESPPPAPPSNATRAVHRLVIHEDSGIRMHDGLVIDIPPSYTPS